MLHNHWRLGLLQDTRPPSRWARRGFVRNNATTMVQSHCELCCDGHPLVSPPRAEPSLPATPGSPDAAAVAFSHGLTAKGPQRQQQRQRLTETLWWWCCDLANVSVHARQQVHLIREGSCPCGHDPLGPAPVCRAPKTTPQLSRMTAGTTSLCVKRNVNHHVCAKTGMSMSTTCS